MNMNSAIKFQKKFTDHNYGVGFYLNAIEEQYRVFASVHELPESVLYAMYSITSSTEPCTQKDICEHWKINKQTVNAAIKYLKKRDYIRLEVSPDNAKFRLIYLTEEGEEFARQLMFPLFEAEINTLEVFSKEEYNLLFSLLKKYYEQLNREITELCSDSKED